jgi:ATP phosphoribosyltransferase regulatory subunit HisZ
MRERTASLQEIKAFEAYTFRYFEAHGMEEPDRERFRSGSRYAQELAAFLAGVDYQKGGRECEPLDIDAHVPYGAI